MNGILPLIFTVGPLQYDITALHHFIEVPRGKYFVPESGSGWGNGQEVEAVGSLVKALEEHCKEITDICVFSAYRTRLSYLREEAERFQWLDSFINTIDMN